MSHRLLPLTNWTSVDRWPSILCPACGHGTVGFGEEPRCFPDSALSHDTLMKGYIDPEDLHGSFVAQLVCGNVNCKHQLALSGEWFPERRWDEYPRDSGWEDQLLVKFVFPALRMINPPEGTPEKVVNAVRAADSLLWMNPSASANQLRQAVEELLTCQKVKRTETKNGKRTRISTHKRIEHYRAKNLDVANMLEAVK